MTCLIGSSDFSSLEKKKKVSRGGFKGYYLHEFSPLSVTFTLLFPPVLKGQRPTKLNEIMSRATRALTSPFLSLFFFFFLFRYWQLLANACMQPVWFGILVHLSLLRQFGASSGPSMELFSLLHVPVASFVTFFQEFQCTELNWT